MENAVLDSDDEDSPTKAALKKMAKEEKKVLNKIKHDIFNNIADAKKSKERIMMRIINGHYLANVQYVSNWVYAKVQHQSSTSIAHYVS
jgi:hypothetical protein